MLIKLDPPPLDPRAPEPGLPAAFPLGQPGVSLHFSARYALLAGLQALGLPQGGRVLLPAYNCGTEVEPVLRAGLTPCFYRVGGDLRADLGQIEGLLRGGAAGALVVTHYFGLPQPPLAELARLCQDRGVILIEDCAHALLGEHLGRPLGSFGDASVFSLIKSLPLPDGGALHLAGGLTPPVPGEEPPPALGRRLLARVARHNATGEGGRLSETFALLRERGLALRRALAERLGGAGGRGVDPRANRFEPGAAAWAMSGLALRLLAGVDLAAIKAARRRNFLSLLVHFQERHPECLLVNELPEGACPLCFPVRLRRRPPEIFARSLAAWGVEGFAWWRGRHPAVPWEDFPEARALKRGVLVLPVHQGLGEEEMARVASAFEAAWRVVG